MKRNELLALGYVKKCTMLGYEIMVRGTERAYIETESGIEVTREEAFVKMFPKIE